MLFQNERTEPGGVVACRLGVKVVPGASRDGVAGVLGERLKVRVAAAPEDGKANEAVCRLLAGVLGVRPRDVEVVSGQTRPEKVVRVVGLDADRAGAALAGHLEGG